MGTGVGLECCGGGGRGGGGCEGVEEEEEGGEGVVDVVDVVVEVVVEEGAVTEDEKDDEGGLDEEETATAVSGFEGATLILGASFCTGLLGWAGGVVAGLCCSFGPGVELGAVAIDPGAFPVGLVLSFRCLPFTMSARLENPVSGGGGGGGGAEGTVEPPARGGK